MKTVLHYILGSFLFFLIFGRAIAEPSSKLLNSTPTDWSMTMFDASTTPSPFVVSVGRAAQVITEANDDDELRRKREAVLAKMREVIRSDFADNPIVGLAMPPDSNDRGSYLRGGKVWRIGEGSVVETIYRDKKRLVEVRVIEINPKTFKIAYVLPGESNEELVELPLPVRMQR